MKKLMWIYAVVLLAFVLLPVPMPGATGVYNSITNLYWCNNDASCLHEKAHQMDRTQGWISHSKEWSDTLHLYVIVQSRSNEADPYVVAILSSFLDYHHKFYYLFNDSNKELYANIYALSNGNKAEMPDSLEPFYLWEDTNE